MFSQVFGLGFR